jgi:tetratricopeptide (TPR) repeat protein
MPELRKVFISHSHKDEPLASAFRDTLKNVFPQVEVAFSSDKTAGGGPQSGSNWLQWINNEMRNCQESLLLLTPYSIRKPWPMWEAGAVGGMALVAAPDGAETNKVVTPIRFNIPEEALPGPFVVTQAVDGRKDESLRKLLGDLMNRYDYATTKVIINAVLNEQIPLLAKKIRGWLDNAPPVVTEGMITEWCSRLDQLREEKRSREVRHLHRWIRLMYEGPAGSESDGDKWVSKKREETWDLRLHLRLAHNYTIAQQFEEAIGQYKLAAELAPLDVFVLHRLAQVYLDRKDFAAARKTIDQILSLDNEALKWNAEVAGLVGRYWKDEGRRCEQTDKPQQAQEAYRTALNAYQNAMEIDGPKVDLYMADNVGQLSLKLGDVAAARKAYERAGAALESVTPETESIWTLATRVTTALVLSNDDDAALGYLGRIREYSPTESQKKSIGSGIELVCNALGKTNADYRRFMAALD